MSKKDENDFCKKCPNIEIVIPKNMTKINDSEFMFCEALSSIVIPDGVIEIGERAFSYCPSLVSLVFDGTKKQWKAIKKQKNWRSHTPIKKVQCLDGVLRLFFPF